MWTFFIFLAFCVTCTQAQEPAYWQNDPVTFKRSLNSFMPADTLPQPEKKKACAGIGCGKGGCLGPNGRIMLQFDTRHSFVVGSLAKLYGLKLGVELHDHYRFGIGWYGMGNKFVNLEPAYQNGDTLTPKLNFSYTTLYFEYVFKQNWRWEFSAPVAIGSGRPLLKYHSAVLDQDFIAINPDTLKVPLLAIGINGQVRVLPFAAIGAGVGYRFLITGEKDVNRALSAPFYMIKFKLMLGDFWKLLTKPQELWEQRDAYRAHRAERKQAGIKHPEAVKKEEPHNE